MLGHQPCHTQILSWYIYQDQSSVYLIVCCIFTTLKPIRMSCWCWHRSKSPVPSAFPAFPWLWCRGAPLRTSFISSLNEVGFQSASVGFGPLVFLFPVQTKGTKHFFIIIFGGKYEHCLNHGKALHRLRAPGVPSSCWCCSYRWHEGNEAPNSPLQSILIQNPFNLIQMQFFCSLHMGLSCDSF